MSDTWSTMTDEQRQARKEKVRAAFRKRRATHATTEEPNAAEPPAAGQPVKHLGREVQDEALRRYHAGESSTALAREYGKGDNWIHGILTRRGLPRRPRGTTSGNGHAKPAAAVLVAVTRRDARPAAAPPAPDLLGIIDAKIAKLQQHIAALEELRRDLQEA